MSYLVNPFDGVLPTLSALALYDPSSGDFGVFLSSRPGATCTSVTSAAFNSIDSVYLQITAIHEPSLMPGIYDIGPSDSGSAVVAHLTSENALCSMISDTAASGSVSLTSASASELAGSYALVFTGYGTLSGSFVASVCAGATQLVATCATP
jgi:hypothetical protein